MKKGILLMFALVTTGVFAQGTVSVGVGGLFDYSPNGDLLGSINRDRVSTNNLSFGGFGFLNFKYVELDVSFAHGSLTAVYEDTKNKKEAGSILQLGFDLLFKIPFDPGGPVLIFPLLGFDYNMVLAGDGDSGFNQIGAMLGVGVDYLINFPFFIRAEAFLHARLPGMGILASTLYGSEENPGFLSGGPRVKVAIGYSF
jgi:hypothetical protein